MKKGFLLIVASLLLSGMMFAQDYYWSDFDFHQWNSYQTVYGKAYLDGELQNRGDVEVAAFVGDELRGRQFLIEPWPGTPAGFYIWTPCYSDVAGEVFTYKAYDHATGILYDLCDTELVSIGTQGSFGSGDDPIPLHFTRTVEPTYGPEYPWTPSTAYQGEGMLVVAQIKINGQLVDRASYEVGAFCGEECRGDSYYPDGTPLNDWTDMDLGYFAFMNIMGNDGDIINFYLYDNEGDSIFPGVCNTTLQLENGGEVGIDIMGGDIFVLNFVTENTFIKEIDPYTDNGGYYLIASPIGEVMAKDVEGLRTPIFDFYSFDQNASDGLEWINHVGEEEYLLQPGMGYLYANSLGEDLVFIGSPYDGDGSVTLEKKEGSNVEFSGWNLVGNPFAQTAYPDRAFYVMNSDGSEIEAAERNSVEAMEGIFVIANNDGETMTFSTTEPEGKGQIVLNVNQNRGNAIDRTIVRFGESSMLPKFMLNQNNTKIYISKEDNDYAVVRSNNSGRLPVNFEPAQDGYYIISVNTEDVIVKYLHLIDHVEGVDIDLLQTPIYKFSAKVADHAERFELVFRTGSGLYKELFAKDGNDSFSFFTNGEWIINNEGDAILQVVDVNGQIMSNEEINGSVSKHIDAAPGVYMLRLIKGKDIKVQKIVIK